jgi:hypothetical protein
VGIDFRPHSLKTIDIIEFQRFVARRYERKKYSKFFYIPLFIGVLPQKINLKKKIKYFVAIKKRINLLQLTKTLKTHL